MKTRYEFNEASGKRMVKMYLEMGRDDPGTNYEKLVRCTQEENYHRRANVMPNFIMWLVENNPALGAVVAMEASRRYEDLRNRTRSFFNVLDALGMEANVERYHEQD